MTNRYLLRLIVLGLMGCSTTRHSHPPGHSVGAARRFDSSLSKPSHRQTCAITFVREPAVSGSGLNLYLDDERIARIAAGEFMTVYVKPGRHRLELRPLFSPRARKLLALGKGEAITVRIVDQNGSFQLKTADDGWFESVNRSLSSWAHRPFSHRDTGG